MKANNNMPKAITKSQERDILSMKHHSKHGQDYKGDGFSIFSFQDWLKDKKTGYNNYENYRLSFLAFIDEPKESNKMPRYLETHSIQKIAAWLKQNLGYEKHEA
jgi:hypothetical protein